MRSEVAASSSPEDTVGGWTRGSLVRPFSPMALWCRFCNDLIFLGFTGWDVPGDGCF